jgi:general secretion pathway protein A
MYERFFNLTAPPFESTPDPAFFFDSEQHREALAAVEYAIRARKGVVVITGDLGAGKTTVTRTVTQRLAEQATIVPLFFGITHRNELLRHALRALGVEARRDDEHALLVEMFRDALSLRARDGRPAVLMIDEAQTLSNDVLDELRLLTTIDGDGQRLLQIVLVGQNELLDRLADPALAALRQRVAMARRLGAFDPRTTQAYIRHRLGVASADPDRVAVEFRGDAVVALYRYSLGVPRLINAVCDHALLLAFVREQRVVTGAIVEAVLSDMLSNPASASQADRPLARIRPTTDQPLARSA